MHSPPHTTPKVGCAHACVRSDASSRSAVPMSIASARTDPNARPALLLISIRLLRCLLLLRMCCNEFTAHNRSCLRWPPLVALTRYACSATLQADPLERSMPLGPRCWRRPCCESRAPASRLRLGSAAVSRTLLLSPDLSRCLLRAQQPLLRNRRPARYEKSALQSLPRRSSGRSRVRASTRHTGWRATDQSGWLCKTASSCAISRGRSSVSVAQTTSRSTS
jgi:hypothetical protein